MLHFAATITLSAFLLFLVQPMLAKFILPWFGGTALVWTTCMIFFQLVLLMGYGYAHWTTSHLKLRMQALLHIALLVIALAFLPILPSAGWKPAGDENPVIRILLLLFATIGLPYFLLSSTSPLVQAWFARSRPNESPYRLFALSNAASFAALLGYPFLFEPRFTARSQAWGWSIGFALFALLVGWLAWRSQYATANSANSIEEQTITDEPHPSWRQIALWLTLSAMGSVMLLGVSNHLTHNIPSIPLLWTVPLAIYLLTFILAFEDQRWYPRGLVLGELMAALVVMAFFLAYRDWQFKIFWHIGVFSIGLFIVCMFCHGELARQKPAPQHLTLFFLIVSAGGVIGGVLVGIVAPLTLPGYLELEIALWVIALLAVALTLKQSKWLAGSMLLVALFTFGVLVYRIQTFTDNTIEIKRNFYGVLRVKEYGTRGEDDHHYSLVHGAILHGEQYQAEKFRQAATTYYKPSSGIGKLLGALEGKAIKVGVIGLGVGTLATYADTDDVYRFYDINPDVITVASTTFTFLKDCLGKVELVLGDARLQLERELTAGPQNFDVLAVDAFSGDSIPVHLITDEALRLYMKHMKPEGVVAFHVSNRFLDLKPVLQALADKNGLHIASVNQSGDDGGTVSDWVLITRHKPILLRPEIVEATQPIVPQPDWSVWTDDFNNIVQVLK